MANATEGNKMLLSPFPLSLTMESPFPASLTGVTCAVLGRLDQLVDAGRLDEPVDQVLESGVLSA